MKYAEKIFMEIYTYKCTLVFSFIEMSLDVFGAFATQCSVRLRKFKFIERGNTTIYLNKYFGSQYAKAIQDRNMLMAALTFL